jgi:hypothetical protein
MKELRAKSGNKQEVLVFGILRGYLLNFLAFQSSHAGTFN